MIIRPDQVVAASWTLVRSPKHAEKMLIQLISATAPSWPAVHCRVATNSDFDRIPNTEYYSFLGIYEYRIPNNIRSWKLTNTEYRILFGQGKFTNTEYRIVLFGLNYSNTELFEHWNGPAYSNFRKECVNLAQMIKVIVNNVSAFKIINIFSHFLSQNVTLKGVF